MKDLTSVTLGRQRDSVAISDIIFLFDSVISFFQSTANCLLYTSVIIQNKKFESFIAKIQEENYESCLQQSFEQQVLYRFPSHTTMSCRQHKIKLQFHSLSKRRRSAEFFS